MATQITATTPRTRPAPRLGVLEVAILAVIAVALIGVGVWSQAGSIRDVTTQSQASGMGYPLHGGLAGPSRVGQVSTVDLAAHYGPAIRSMAVSPARAAWPCRRSTRPLATGPAIRSMAVSPARAASTAGTELPVGPRPATRRRPRCGRRFEMAEVVAAAERLPRPATLPTILDPSLGPAASWAGMDETLQFRILGSLSVVGNGSVAALGPPKQRALLAILLTRIGETVPVERLVELLWGTAAPRTADHSIQIYVSDLRRAFEPLGGSDLLVTRQPGYVLDLDPDSVDAWRFERLLKEGTRLLEDGDLDAGRAKIREALGLWSGPPLSDFPYEEFAQPVARRLTEERLTAVEAYAAASLEAGRITEALDLLTAAVQDDPLRERARELMMLALYRSGRHADALRSFHALRTQLTDEFGVDPSPSIRALYDRILAHDPSLGKGSLAGPNVRVTLACEGAGVGGRPARGGAGLRPGGQRLLAGAPERERGALSLRTEIGRSCSESCPNRRRHSSSPSTSTRSTP